MFRKFAKIVGFDTDELGVPVSKVAVGLVRAGYAVVPVKPGGKKK